MANETPTQIGPYQILEQLGRGGMAVVYRAVQTTLNRTVAVKVLPENIKDAAWTERFHREAQAVAMLNHPNIVQIIDKGEEDGQLYFAMEYVPGTSLDKVLERRRLSLSEALKVFKEVCKGLEYAHQHKVIHRDLNPRNVLVSEDLSTVKLADFGICRVESISREQGTLSTREVSFGTLHYLAPEQASNMASSDHRSDIFSLGVLLYEMLTGKVPVGRFSLPSRLNGEVPPEIDPIVLRCLATEPSERYQSVTQLLAQVRKLEENLRLRLVDELKGFSRSTSKILRRSTRTFGKRKYAGLIAGAVLLVLVVVVLLFTLFNRGTPSSREVTENPPATGEPVETAASPPATEEAAPGAGSVPGPQTPKPAEPDQTRAAPDRSTTPVPRQAAQSAGEPETPRRSRSSSASRQALSEARQKLENGATEAALSDVNALLEGKPGNTVTTETLLLKGQILHQLKRISDEKSAYQQIIDEFPSNDQATEARYRLAETLRAERAQGWEQTALGLFSQVGAQSGSEFAPAALLRQGEIEGILKKTTQDPTLGREVPSALVTYRRLVDNYPDSDSAEYGYWSLSNMYQELGLFEQAVKMLTELGTRFPASNWDPWWFAGGLYEEKLKDNQGAFEAYSKVPETSRNYQRAQRKVRRLGPPR